MASPMGTWTKVIRVLVVVDRAVVLRQGKDVRAGIDLHRALRGVLDECVLVLGKDELALGLWHMVVPLFSWDRGPGGGAVLGILL